MSSHLLYIQRLPGLNKKPCYHICSTQRLPGLNKNLCYHICSTYCASLAWTQISVFMLICIHWNKTLCIHICSTKCYFPTCTKSLVFTFAIQKASSRFGQNVLYSYLLCIQRLPSLNKILYSCTASPQLRTTISVFPAWTKKPRNNICSTHSDSMTWKKLRSIQRLPSKQKCLYSHFALHTASPQLEQKSVSLWLEHNYLYSHLLYMQRLPSRTKISAFSFAFNTASPFCTKNLLYSRFLYNHRFPSWS